jgi:hypothetical protein
MRSGKVDLSVSSTNQSKASQILQKMRGPDWAAVPVTEENPQEMEEDEPPPLKLSLPPTVHIAALLQESSSAAPGPT